MEQCAHFICWTHLHILVVILICFYMYVLNLLYVFMGLFCLSFHLFSVSVPIDILMLILEIGEWGHD